MFTDDDTFNSRRLRRKSHIVCQAQIPVFGLDEIEKLANLIEEKYL